MGIGARKEREGVERLVGGGLGMGNVRLLYS